MTRGADEKEERALPLLARRQDPALTLDLGRAVPLAMELPADVDTAWLEHAAHHRACGPKLRDSRDGTEPCGIPTRGIGGRPSLLQ